MGDRKQETAKQELTALHAALLRQRREAGTLQDLIPVPEWEGILTRTLDVMTRQTAQDKTWAMERLGYLVRIKKEGVRILDPEAQALVAA